MGNKNINWKRVKKVVITLAVIIFLIVAAATSIYSVNDKQQGVVTRFGKVTQVNDAGLYFMLPFGIETFIREWNSATAPTLRPQADMT